MRPYSPCPTYTVQTSRATSAFVRLSQAPTIKSATPTRRRKDRILYPASICTRCTGDLRGFWSVTGQPPPDQRFCLLSIQAALCCALRAGLGYPMPFLHLIKNLLIFLPPNVELYNSSTQRCILLIFASAPTGGLSGAMTEPTPWTWN